MPRKSLKLNNQITGEFSLRSLIGGRMTRVMGMMGGSGGPESVPEGV